MQSNLTNERLRFVAFATIAIALIASLTGCGTIASVPLDRAKVESLKTVDLVRVETPPMQVMTFMQAWAQSSAASPGVVVAGVAESEGTTLLTPPAIPDLGAMFTDRLREQLPKRAAWWPQMIEVKGAVKNDYVHTSGNWIRVEVERLQLAPAPLRTVYTGVSVSLRSPTNEILWAERTGCCSLIQGAERIDLDRLPADFSQLRSEIERAAQRMVDRFAESIQQAQSDGSASPIEK